MMKTTPLTSLALLLVVLLLTACHVQPMQDRCGPRFGAQRACVQGCLSCWKTYGGELYDTASCCRECSKTGAVLIDFAPSRCSLRHVQSTWLKRFG